ncbi:MAG: helix-turn-helix transcriptional regulator [Clostridium sp.]|nr:helix-turn-helix transcriptional regulator [Clostridium sp.]
MKDRIKKIRKELDLTQQEFADKLKVPRNTIGGYEVGKSNPSDAAVNNICNTFKVNEEWLRTGNGEMFVKQTRNEEMAKLTKLLLNEEEDSFKNRLISVLANLTEDQWELLADIAEKLSKEKG